MKPKHLIYPLIILITFFTSCVGEDVVFVSEDDTLNFERQLRSLAEDEDFDLNVIFSDANNNVIEDQSKFTIEYSSSNTNAITVTNQGIISAVSSNGSSIITVNASSADFIFPEIQNEIIVGKVTMTESEALLKNDEEEVTRIITEGYDPEITITNPISEIGLGSSNVFQFNGLYQNLKKEIEEVTLIWSSNDIDILEITNEGVLTPISLGTTTITVSFGDIESTIEVTVTDNDSIVIIEDEPEDTIEILGFGMLQSNSSYGVVGNFQIIKENGVTSIFLDDTYSSPGLPDLVIYLSNVTDTNNGASFISEEITGGGAQSFIIPNSINPDEYTNVLLYCRGAGVRVGFGVINR